MVISPNDFSLWSRLTGNKYPSTPRERAQKGPEVQRFIQNLDKEGMLGGKQEEEKKKEKSLPEKLATGALIAGGVAAGVAAARDKRVQDVAQRAGATAKDKVQEFLKNLGPGQEVDVDIVDASGDVTPNPREQQSNVGSQVNKFLSEGSYIRNYNPNPVDIEIGPDPYTPPVSQPKEPVAVDNFKPVVEGETFGTSGAISRLEDIGDAKLRAERTYEPMINALQQKNPGINLGGMRRQMLKNAEKDRDFDIAYMVAKGQGKDDADSVMIARQAAGFSGGKPGEPTEYRKFLGEQRTGSIIRAKIDDLIDMVQPGQIRRVEGVDQSNLDKYGTWQNNTQVSFNNKTPDNKIIKVGAEIGGTTLVDQQATKMAVDNALDNARNAYEKQVSTIVDAGRTGGGSIKSRAGAEAFLQRFRPDVVKNLDTAIQEDLQTTTGLNPEDAANIAESVIDPTTGQRQFDTDRFGEAGAETKRTIKDLKSVPNIDPDTNQGIMKTAVGTAIRGRAPSYYEALPKTETRELPGKFEEIVPDRRTATRGGFGAALQKSIEEEGISPAKMPEGGSAGIGIYGEGTGYLAGPFSETAKKAPTDVPGVSSPFKGVSDKRVEQFKADAKPGTKTFESADKELKGRASIDIARQLRQIQTTGNPETVNERTNAFFNKLDPTGELRKRNRG